MKHKAIFGGKKGDSAACLKNSVDLFVDCI
jgi:hypothetical protein